MYINMYVYKHVLMNIYIYMSILDILVHFQSTQSSAYAGIGAVLCPLFILGTPWIFLAPLSQSSTNFDGPSMYPLYHFSG